MKRRKWNFEEALEHINEERAMLRADVSAAALRRKVWVAEWHLPGCLSESRGIYLTKEDAVQAGADFADGTPCRGIKKALREQGFFQHKTDLYGYVNTTVERLTLGDLL